MSGDAHDFNIEKRAVIKSLAPPRQGTEGNSRHSDRNIRRICTIKNWVSQFKRGDFFNCDAPRPGLPKTMTTPDMIDEIHELILEDRRPDLG
jgi:hypothetical protein